MQKPFSKYQLGLLGASIPKADSRQPPSSLTLPHVELSFCSTWLPRGTRAAGTPEAGELPLMQGTESLGQQHEGGALGRGNGSAERLAWTGATLEPAAAAARGTGRRDVSLCLGSARRHFNNSRRRSASFFSPRAEQCVSFSECFLKWNLIHL